MIPENAVKYAQLLVNSNMTSIDRLERALSKKSSYMTDIGIDSTDAEDILEALNHRKQAPDTNTTAKATNTTAPLPAAEAAVATPPATLAPAATSGKCQTSCHTLLTYQSK